MYNDGVDVQLLFDWQREQSSDMLSLRGCVLSDWHTRVDTLCCNATTTSESILQDNYILTLSSSQYSYNYVN